MISVTPIDYLTKTLYFKLIVENLPPNLFGRGIQETHKTR